MVAILKSEVCLTRADFILAYLSHLFSRQKTERLKVSIRPAFFFFSNYAGNNMLNHTCESDCQEAVNFDFILL